MSAAPALSCHVNLMSLLPVDAPLSRQLTRLCVFLFVLLHWPDIFIALLEVFSALSINGHALLQHAYG